MTAALYFACSMRKYQVCPIYTKLGGCGLHLVPKNMSSNFKVTGGQICVIFATWLDSHETWWMWTSFGPEKHGGDFKVIGGQICVIYAVFLTVSDLEETWWMWTIVGPEQHEGHFKVIGGPICVIYAVFLTLLDLNETR